MSKWMCLLSVLMCGSACDFVVTDGENNDPVDQSADQGSDAQDAGADPNADCVIEMTESPLNRGGSFGPTTITGGVCDGADEFVLNVDTGCTMKAQLRFDEEFDEENNLVADGSLKVMYLGNEANIGTSERLTNEGEVFITNNPTDDSYGAVLVRVTHLSGGQLNYTLTLSATCP